MGIDSVPYLAIGGAIILGGVAFAVAYAVHAQRTFAFARRFNARDPEAIAAWLPPGHRYDAEAGLVYPPEPGALPYHLPELVVHV